MLESSDLMRLSNDELFELSLVKFQSGKRKGCATPTALKAQKILHERAGCPFISTAHIERDYTAVKIFI